MSKEIDKYHTIKLRRTGTNFDGTQSFDVNIFCSLTSRNHRIAWFNNREDAILHAKKYAKENKLHYEDHELEASTPQSRNPNLTVSNMFAEREDDEPL